MKLSELIAKLQELQKEHGDVKVFKGYFEETNDYDDLDITVETACQELLNCSFFPPESIDLDEKFISL